MQVGQRLWWILPALVLSGALGMPYLRDEVPFESVERQHFDAFAVARDSGNPSDAPLILRVDIRGDAAHADISRATQWLRDHANVIIVPDSRGAPLFLTHGDLAATSGRATLGATVRTGMAVEVTDNNLAACVIVHETLHFLGLRHVSDQKNIMYAHCSRKQLDRAELTDGQRDALASVAEIRATTPRGVQTWATR